MADRIKAEATPYSSIVGGGITLTDESGRVVGQLALIGLSTPPARDCTKAQYRAEYLAVCERLAKAINAGQED